MFNKKKKKVDTSKINYYNLLMELKPKGSYIFHSDYFKIDDTFCSILSFFHSDGSNIVYPPFWGILMVPHGLSDGVSIILLEQTKKLSQAWVTSHQEKADRVYSVNSGEQSRSGSRSNKSKLSEADKDLFTIASDLNSGSSYLHKHYRLLVKAPTLDELDIAISHIKKQYTERFSVLNIAAYPGCQRDELSNLFNVNALKKGRGFYYTSTELAGSYNLVTHGLEDPSGEFVGIMKGDVNSSAVMFDVNMYNKYVVVASEQTCDKLDVKVADMWASKISQSCMLNNGRVVHIVLNGANLDKLGPRFDGITYRLNMNSGDINMFEMFGDEKDELGIFASQIKKLKLMAKQSHGADGVEASMIDGALEAIVTRFYIDQKMWVNNAAEHRNLIRVVNLPHNEYPKLKLFCDYLESEYKALTNKKAKDLDEYRAVSLLNKIFRNLVTTNGDLFNTHTTSRLDGAKTGIRTIYDFGGLMLRGKNIAMTQLVNVISFAVGNLGKGDTVIVHGCEYIDDGIKSYLKDEFNQLIEKGGRVCYCYTKNSVFVKDIDFSEFNKADYLILGNLSVDECDEYEKAMKQNMQFDLKSLITKPSITVSYIKRGFDNIVFDYDLRLGLKPSKKRGRRR